MTTNDPLRGERRPAAIMFTDMVRFTALSQRDEALALRLVEEHRQPIRSHLAMHDGREMKTMGDGAPGFTSSLAVVRCAIEIQLALAALIAERRQD
jgi:class 3 adenylate cyclase